MFNSSKNLYILDGQVSVMFCSYAWVIQDILGFAFCINVMKTVHIPNLKVIEVVLDFTGRGTPSLSNLYHKFLSLRFGHENICFNVHFSS